MAWPGLAWPGLASARLAWRSRAASALRRLLLRILHLHAALGPRLDGLDPLLLAALEVVGGAQVAELTAALQAATVALHREVRTRTALSALVLQGHRLSRAGEGYDWMEYTRVRSPRGGLADREAADGHAHLGKRAPQLGRRYGPRQGVGRDLIDMKECVLDRQLQASSAACRCRSSMDSYRALSCVSAASRC